MDTTDFSKMCWAQERDRFRRTIAAAVEDRLDWQPEPRSRTVRRLIGHMIGHIQDVVELADDGVINHRNEVPVTTLEDALGAFDRSYDQLEASLAGLGGEDWARPADFKVGDMVIMHAPVEQLVWLMLFDAIHHRGQLTTYLRPCGGQVPALYGPSADEEMPAH